MIVAERGVTLTYDESIRVHAVSAPGQIRLRPDLDAAQELSFLARNFAHELLHHRQGRSDLPFAQLEAEAKGVAWVVERGLRLQTSPEAAESISVYKADAASLATSLAEIHKTAARILTELQSRERGVPVERIPEDRGARDLRSISGEDTFERSQAPPPDR